MGRRPNMSFMKIWGCKAYVKHQMTTKLEPKSEKCTFVGYPKETKGYYFYNENKVFVARTGVFHEKEFLQQDIEPKVEEISQVVEENPTDLETQPLRRSTRERHEPERYGFLITTHGDVILVDQDEPKTYQEAVASPDSEKWLEAMRFEMDSMSDNHVWNLVEPPVGIKPIGCKWVFKKKTDMDGNVQTYKGRLVAKAAFHDYEIWQMDVKTAFLNGKLEEGVYMTQPEGFVTPENARKETTYQPYSLLRLGYTDTSFQTDKDDSRSQSGFLFCLNGGAVSWKSSKQDTVADSRTEAEYIAASEAAKEAVWIKKFITSLGVIPSIVDAVDLYCDNNGAIAQAKKPRSHQRSKHILRRFHLIREIIDRGDVEICKVHTDDNIADPLTKPLAQQKHDRHTE
ncbi:hypothetical protein GQ457_09G017270 [Hibiscus cannabinus]